MLSAEWIVPVATFVLGAALALAAWIFQREVRRSDESADEARADRGKLRKEVDAAILKLENEIEKVEKESLVRDDKLQKELSRAFSIFAQEGTIDRIENRIGNLDQKVDRVLEMMAQEARRN